MNNVVTISGEQWRDSAIHIHVSILSQTSLPSRLPHNIEQSSLCYTVGPCWLSILNIAVQPSFWTVGTEPILKLILITIFPKYGVSSTCEKPVILEVQMHAVSVFNLPPAPEILLSQYCLNPPIFISTTRPLSKSAPLFTWITSMVFQLTC